MSPALNPLSLQTPAFPCSFPPAMLGRPAPRTAGGVQEAAPHAMCSSDLSATRNPARNTAHQTWDFDRACGRKGPDESLWRTEASLNRRGKKSNRRRKKSTLPGIYSLLIRSCWRTMNYCSIVSPKLILLWIKTARLPVENQCLGHSGTACRRDGCYSTILQLHIKGVVQHSGEIAHCHNPRCFPVTDESCLAPPQSSTTALQCLSSLSVSPHMPACCMYAQLRAHTNGQTQVVCACLATDEQLMCQITRIV